MVVRREHGHLNGTAVPQPGATIEVQYGAQCLP